MATRATYMFNTSGDKKIVYYCHYDNYPEGAAHYLFQMHKQEVPTQGGLPEKFIIGNPEHARFVPSHESCGDTEYRYDISIDGILTAFRRVDFSGDEFVEFFKGRYEVFINQYNTDNITLHEVKSIHTYLGSKYMTISELEDCICERLRSYLRSQGTDYLLLEYRHFLSEYERILKAKGLDVTFNFDKSA
jgi:hypothetical protein